MTSLTVIIDLALWAGQLLMHNGAETQRVEETVRTLGAGLGCDWGDVFVSPTSITVTHFSQGELHTTVRRVRNAGVNDSVNMALIEGISHLTHRVAEGQLDQSQVWAELWRIDLETRSYNRWLTIAMIGLACAAYSRLFGGDWSVFSTTLVSASAAMFVRQTLSQRQFNPLIIVIITAFAAGLLVGIGSWLQLCHQPGLALAASTLLLVPGVPFINGVEDLIKGHTSVGLARGIAGLLIIFAIALGLLLAMRLTGVKGL